MLNESDEYNFTTIILLVCLCVGVATRISAFHTFMYILSWFFLSVENNAGKEMRMDGQVAWRDVLHRPVRFGKIFFSCYDGGTVRTIDVDMLPQIGPFFFWQKLCLFFAGTGYLLVAATNWFDLDIVGICTIWIKDLSLSL